MGRQGEHIFKSLVFAEDGDEGKYDKVLEKFDSYFVPKRNVIHERARFHLRVQNAVKEELDRLEKLGVIMKITTPSDWCAPIVPVVKKNGKVRICVDLKRLNKAVKREHYMLPNLDDISPKMSGAKVFSKLDATSGFHQIPLEKDSYKFTTFITPFGRYCYTRLPFGITSAPEIFQRRMSDLLSDLDGVSVIIDDVIIYGESMEEHDRRLKTVMDRLVNNGVKLNLDKCEYRKDKIEYFGHVISSAGIQPSSERIRAIQQLKPPTNVAELRRIIGLAYYDAKRPTIVSADASSFGIGAALYQTVDGEMQPIAYASRSLTEAEKKYAQIEKECLAAVWACERFDRYITGLPSFRLITDHKPLVPLINTQDLNRTPLRCQRLLMRFLRVNAVAEYQPGKQLVSRSPLTESESSTSEGVETYIDSVLDTKPMSDRRFDEIRTHTNSDPVLKSILNYVKYGWPSKESAIYPGVKPYFSSRNELIHRPKQQSEPLKPTALPQRPWQRVGIDLFELQGKQFLVVCDYFSRFIEIAYLESITSETVIGKLKNIFARWGVPDEFVSDNGGQFASEAFRKLAASYGFYQIFSSPHYPQANGAAESAVKIAKRILKQDDVFLALMAYRSTPIQATGEAQLNS
uniref:Uncharacterized protein K02A2.6-like n=1 Tax=Crassostrea virginica TaxID=6565 RepID=A0A8B8C872_CRAVI|nr:uncharacterized protein K02A2.6-like [Crassostrea virginica]